MASRLLRLAPGSLAILFATGLLAALPLRAHAQVWNEQGDAGDGPAAAQFTYGAGALTEIDGNLTDGQDVDMYAVVPNSPTASLCLVCEGPGLWLFKSDGLGVLATTQCEGACMSISLLNAPGLSGVTYVAVSAHGRNPYAPGFLPIWDVGPTGGSYFTQKAPDGPGAAGAVAQWSGTGVLPQSAYQILLDGFSFASGAPVPVQGASWGRLKSMYR